MKQSPGCPNKEVMQSLSTFIRIRGPIPEIKKPVLINDWKNIAYWKESEQSKRLANKFGLFKIQLELEGLRGSLKPKKIL